MKRVSSVSAMVFSTMSMMVKPDGDARGFPDKCKQSTSFESTDEGRSHMTSSKS